MIMQYFLDTAIPKEIQDITSMFNLAGLTSNPALLKKAVKEATGEQISYLQACAAICALVPGSAEVSLEVLEKENHAEMARQARVLHAVDPDKVVVKLPIGGPGFKAAGILKKEGIKTNLTLGATFEQSLLAADAGAYCCSIFIDRLERDYGEDALGLLRKICSAYRERGYKTKIIAASIKNLWQVRAAEAAGADIATIPYNVFLQMFSHPLTEKGIESFGQDAAAAGFKIP